MTNMVRTIHDPTEADEARHGAYEEFIAEVDQHDAGHLVTDEALERWFTPRPRRNREAVIREEFGPPVSVLSIMEERRSL